MIERLAAARDPRRASAPTSSATASTTGAASRSWDCVQISISPNLPQFAGRTIGGARRRARPGSDRHGLRLSDRGQGGHARAGHLDLGGRHRAISCREPEPMVGSDGNCVGDLRHRQPGHAASALLRHVPAHLGALRRRARAAAARAGDQQDDRRHRAGAAPRTTAVCCKQGYRADVAIFDPADFKDQSTYAEAAPVPERARAPA